MEIGLTKMSSKGQIVIPKEMRKKIKEGEKLLIVRNKDVFILRKATKAIAIMMQKDKLDYYANIDKSLANEYKLAMNSLSSFMINLEKLLKNEYLI